MWKHYFEAEWVFQLRKINLLPLTYSHFHRRTFSHANYFSSFSLLEQQHGALLTRLLSTAVWFFFFSMSSATRLMVGRSVLSGCWCQYTHTHSLPFDRTDLDLKPNTQTFNEALPYITDEPALRTQDKWLSLALSAKYMLWPWASQQNNTAKTT